MDKAEAAANTRLSEELGTETDPVRLFWLCAFFSLCGCLAALVGYAGMAVGERWKHASSRARIQPDDTETYQLMPGSFGRPAGPIAPYEPPKMAMDSYHMVA